MRLGAPSRPRELHSSGNASTGLQKVGVSRALAYMSVSGGVRRAHAQAGFMCEAVPRPSKLHDLCSRQIEHMRCTENTVVYVYVSARWVHAQASFMIRAAGKN
eukprot:1162107-Pelagomonas_calceolata.AAC.6